MPVLYRARWSFVGQTRSLLQTGRLMARWAEQAAELIAPGAGWEATVKEHADFELSEQWESSHVVLLRAGERGAGRSRLTAGGRGKSVAGTSQVTLRTLAPLAYFEADGHCNVEHWDVRAGGIDETVLDAIRLILEQEIGAVAARSVGQLETYERGPVEVADTTHEDEARLWMDDLEDTGLPATVQARADGAWVVSIVRSELRRLDELERARITLGEVLAEAGHDDWSARCDEVLAQLA